MSPWIRTLAMEAARGVLAALGAARTGAGTGRGVAAVAAGAGSRAGGEAAPGHEATRGEAEGREEAMTGHFARLRRRYAVLCVLDVAASAVGWFSLGAAPFQDTARGFWLCLMASFVALIAEMLANRARTRIEEEVW